MYLTSIRFSDLMWTLLVLVSLSGCTHTLDDILVSVPGDKTPYTNNLNPSLGYETPVLYAEIEYDGRSESFYLVRMGFNRLRDCTIERTPLELDSEGFLYMNMSGKSERCSGVGCTSCGFKTIEFGSGCVCKDGTTNICEHTITRNEDMILWR